MPTPIATTVSADITAPLSKTFAIAVPIDIPSIMKPRARLPGVASVVDQTGAWDAAGQSRRIYLTDGSSVYEELTAYNHNESFTYRVSDFSGALGPLVTHANGAWRFIETGPQATRIDWTYSFTPKSVVTAPIVWFIVKILWSGYIQSALQRVKEIIEKAPDAEN